MMWVQKRFESTVGLAIFGMLFALALLSGCATKPAGFTSASPRPFSFAQDTFAFPNELVWEYYFDENGKWTNRRREPAPDYSHHCFVVAHRAKQFFQHANFAPGDPIADDKTYRRLIREIISLSDFEGVERRVTVPGYANLREFSSAKESLLKEECGGAWRSYFQRGHWRIMLPFTRRGQKITKQELIERLRLNGVAVLHLVRFPQLTINHAIVAYDFRQTGQGTEFEIYDPNKPEKPGKLTFDDASRAFLFPANDYFIGGKVNVYEVYRSCFY